MTKMQLAWVTIFLITVVVNTGVSVNIDIVSRLYLPFTYDPVPQYAAGESVAEQIAYDKNKQLLYTAGNNILHVVNMSDVTKPEVLAHFIVDDVDITDIQVCGDFVFTANANEVNRLEGFVDVYRSYVTATGVLERVQHIIVGDLPDMIEITKNCHKVIVAMEAEPYDNETTSKTEDGPGAVVFINFNGSPAGSFSKKEVNFAQFDDKFPELEKQGVRHVYRENGNSFSNDAEPEFIAINKQETLAYVSLQENNAIVKLDLTQDQVVDIYGLGYKDWSNLALDPSDKDGGINLHPYRVLGMYQPDAIKVFSFRDVEYLITAGEGDSKDYKFFSEEDRVHDLGLSEMYEPTDTVREQLDGDDKLGRLKITNTQGLNSTNNKFDTLYSYGTRSFSIWQTSTMELVYDSGSELSEKVAELYPKLFNSDIDLGETLADTLDSRSDDKGLEPESLEIIEIGSIHLVFLGFERPGGVFVYSIDERLPTIQPKFEALLIDVPANNMTATWSDLYKDRLISMIDCEDMRYISAEDSPNGLPLLVAAGSKSGSITVITVDISNFTFNSAVGIKRHMVLVSMAVSFILIML